MEIIKNKPAKWDNEGESFSQIILVSARDEEEIRDECAYRCGCEHDCCGHVQTSAHNIRKVGDEKFVVRVGGYRNI